MSARASAMVALLLALAAIAGCDRHRSRPNIVLISIDCMNERQLEEATGDDGAPNLTALMKESLVFTRAYAHAPWTTPSHMSMLTGLYPSQHGRDVPIGLMLHYGKLEERVPTFESIADRLGKAGYESVAFVGHGVISARFGLAQGFATYHEAGRNNSERSDLVETRPALEKWLNSRSPRPFFLFVHTYDLHGPRPVDRRPAEAAIRYIDGQLGKLFQLLRERGLYESTAIFVTGDHGSEMHRKGKCAMHGCGHYEENLRVPLLLKLPAPGAAARHDVLVRHVDLLPTVLDIVGLGRGSYGGPGTSILARLHGDHHEVVSFSETDAFCLLRRALVNPRYKYIYTPQDPWSQVLRTVPEFALPICERLKCQDAPLEELYDLQADPFEEHDLLRGVLTPEAEEALRALRAQMDEHLNLPRGYRVTTLADAQADRRTPAVNDERVKESLRALGYIDDDAEAKSSPAPTPH